MKNLSKYLRLNRINKNKRMILLLKNSTSDIAKDVVKAMKILFAIFFLYPQYSL